ncbi:helix-turn-helix domain-containing protein [Chitinophaga horti]|uniref:Helix-turn-helix domain-containing protein n=1 Tax=Chitinophaga horti TaxID=2920382 RepID=A0ABY6JBL2_9BACT|nr:helix-turn-helix domain-containing protein [Chitinophaga horti]UYQ95777.1 helix-turn-helix domain-containing protein [Chitinophaga horti]
MDFNIIQPPQCLEKYIRFFWTMDSRSLSPEDNTFRMFARRFPRLVFQHNDGHSAIYHGTNFLPLSYLSGLNTLPYECGIQPSFTTTGVSFYPHAVKLFFKVDACHLVNELPDLVNFVPQWLTDALLDEPLQTRRISILIRFFSKKLTENASTDPIAEAGWRMIHQVNQKTVIRHLLTMYNISERQLERRFKSTVGFSPKQFLKIARFERSIEALRRKGDMRLSDIAYDLNYCDQSHFIREFREFSNQTPLEYLNQQILFQENSAMIVKK